MSREDRVMSHPGCSVFEHGVEDGEQLPHAGYQGHLLGLAGRQQALIESPDYRVVAAGHQRCHVEGGPDGGEAPKAATRTETTKRFHSRAIVTPYMREFLIIPFPPR
jgi:hypothetical protein